MKAGSHSHSLHAFPLPFPFPSFQRHAHFFPSSSSPMAARLRSARWLIRKPSAWLLFGVSACFCAAPVSIPVPPKRVFLDYSITEMTGDGRCLFRALAFGAGLRIGIPEVDSIFLREFADELRQKVVDELLKRREQLEWFIEEDFDTYVKEMRKSTVWGGEPELLMSSHILKTPIRVYMYDKSSKGLICIAEYGSEYGNQNPIKVLYDSRGHYDALEIQCCTNYPRS